MKVKSTRQLLAENEHLIHSRMQKVSKHVQRKSGDWYLNTVQLDGYDVPFKYKRRKQYKSLEGASVDVIYYPDKEEVANMEFEVMRVVQINLA